MKHSFKNVVL